MSLGCLEVQKFGFHFTAPIRIASENYSVVDSKAYLVAFKTFVFIIFYANYSITFLFFILCSRWSKMIGKEFRELKE